MKLGPENLRNILLAGFLASFVLATMALIVGVSKTQTGDGWLSLCGSVFGAMITLFAGILAWDSIQKQMELAAADAKRKSDTAMRMARAHGENIMEFCGRSIAMLTAAIEGGDDLRQIHANYAAFCNEKYFTLCTQLASDINLYTDFIPIDLLRNIRISDALASDIYLKSQREGVEHEIELYGFIDKITDLEAQVSYIRDYSAST